MTDREMLELAGKAANQERSFAGDLWSSSRGCLWDPLGNDGDALRLAVKLGIGMVHHLGWGQVFHPELYGERIDFHYDPDAQTATRRAIVRAAAELGKVES
ncbi:hypothetical protein ACW910_24395 (plasmid) [Burkholderia ambifaria]